MFFVLVLESIGLCLITVWQLLFDWKATANAQTSKKLQMNLWPLYLESQVPDSILAVDISILEVHLLMCLVCFSWNIKNIHVKKCRRKNQRERKTFSLINFYAKSAEQSQMNPPCYCVCYVQMIKETKIFRARCRKQFCVSFQIIWMFFVWKWGKMRNAISVNFIIILFGSLSTHAQTIPSSSPLSYNNNFILWRTFAHFFCLYMCFSLFTPSIQTMIINIKHINAIEYDCTSKTRRRRHHRHCRHFRHCCLRQPVRLYYIENDAIQ